MQKDEHNTADTIRAPGSNHEDSSSRVQLSANTRTRLEKLARWRIYPASLEFPERGPKVEGGYAIVSKAVNRRPHMGRLVKDVAVKKMKVKTQDDVVRVLGLTLREAEFLVKLSHENIIKLEGFVEDVSNNMIWLVFPWEDKGTLKHFIASADWEIPERVSLINDVAKGVEYLHGREPPICHGDLKSINILVNSKCRAVITDFGSARHPVAKSPNKESERTTKEPQPTPSLEATHDPSTNTITLTCNHYTLRWAAPELLAEEDATLASDIWALGWVAYEVMTNTIPFQGVGDGLVIKRVVRGDLPSISSDARMLLIQALCSLMRQCWDIEPRKRPSVKDCRNSIGWIPMIAPNPMRTEGTTGLVNRSPELLKRLGMIHLNQNDYATASQYFTEALAIYTDRADSRGRARALSDLAHLNQLQRKYDQALTLYSECLQIWTDIGDRRERAETLLNLAGVHRVRKEYSQAIAFCSECLQIQTDMGDRRGRADALKGLAEVHQARKEYSQAFALYSECLQIQTDMGNRRWRASALLNLAEVHRLQKEYSQAIALLSDALTIYTETGYESMRAVTLWYMGNTHRDQNDHSSAIHAYEQAAEIYKQNGSPYEVSVLNLAADVRRSLGQGDA